MHGICHLCQPVQAEERHRRDPEEHISPEGAEIRTRGERRRLMAKNGLDYKDVSDKKRGARIYVDLGR